MPVAQYRVTVNVLNNNLRKLTKSLISKYHILFVKINT